ncbi:hypothetical protein [Amycolatopsis jejuensis]|uniref:hypothetical protein n=1 Tax=Amycolatopsis jejuensis TaxID=330084 RepID=UPI0012E00171|nr:hypothetical protein [Amycolatopsis jejuensis]
MTDPIDGTWSTELDYLRSESARAAESARLAEEERQIDEDLLREDDQLGEGLGY